MSDRDALLDELELKKLGLIYAQAMDRNEPEKLDAIMTDDILVEGPGFSIVGREANRQSPAMLRQMYAMTQHVVHNQTVAITSDTAQGETYCTASHMTRDGDAGSILVWALRYQDRYRRDDGRWRFSGRKLILDWSETRPVQLGS